MQPVAAVADAIRMPIHVGALYLQALRQRAHDGERCCVLKAWMLPNGPFLEVHEVPLTRADIQKRSN